MEDLQLFLPMAARPQLPGIEARPRLPGIGARAKGFPLPEKSSGSDVVGSASLPELGFIPKTPSPGQRRRSVSDAVLAVSLTFHHSHAQPSTLAWAQDCSTQSWRGHRILAWAQDCSTQSWRGHRIAPLNPGVGAGLLHSILAWAPLNPGVGTGLLHSILAWAQDCSTQSWRGHRIAPVFPRKTLEAQCCTALRPQTRRPDCAENTGSASVHTDALPDSPPGFPASNLASNAKEMGKIKLFPTTEYSSKQSSDPVVPLVPCTGIFLGPSKSGLILEQYRGVFERIYVFSPSVNIDDGWIPVKKYIEGDLGVNTEREQTYWDEWDEAALRRIIQQQRKITEASKNGLGPREHALPAPAGQRGRGRAGRPVRQQHERRRSASAL